MSEAIEFLREMTPDYGAAVAVSPLVRRVLARNPSHFTFLGTGTYIVGRGEVAVIDPGPDDADHIAALVDALTGERVTHILITHTHQDHSPGARRLQDAVQAPTFAYGPHPVDPEGRRPDQGGDLAFRPDHLLADGDGVAGPGWTLTALHTPGHISNHLCFSLAEEKTLFSGDHVMGWSTSVVSPPDGDMAAYFASLRKLIGRDETRFFPTHGPPIPNPQAHVRAFIGHRRARENQIMACVRDGLATVPQMVERMYREVPAHLHPAAARSVLAHLVHMTGDGRLVADGPVGEIARYTVAS